jgi:tRNA G18 (ribose-2'-O)-methylase SpoU
MRGDYDLNELEAEEDLPVISSENQIKLTQNISLQDLKLNSDDNIILILGSEGFGVSKDLTNNLVNFNVYIPPRLDKNKINHHPYDLIDSLNVGVSAGIIINNIAIQLKEDRNIYNEGKIEIKI